MLAFEQLFVIPLKMRNYLSLLNDLDIEAVTNGGFGAFLDDKSEVMSYVGEWE